MNIKENSVEFVDGREYPIKGWSLGIDKGTDKLSIKFCIDEFDSFIYTIDEHRLERKGIGDDHFYEETEIRAIYINGRKYECRCELKPKAKGENKDMGMNHRNEIRYADDTIVEITTWERLNSNLIEFKDEIDNKYIYMDNTRVLLIKAPLIDRYHPTDDVIWFNIEGAFYKCNRDVKSDVTVYADYLASGGYRSKYMSYKEYRKKPKVLIPEIEKVIFNPPATIIMWKDNTKTVVKCGENEMYDPEFGMAMAISKKALGNQGSYYNTLKKWVGPYWQKEFDEAFIEVIRGYLDHCCEYIHPITVTYWVERILDDTDGYLIHKLTRKEKERLRQLAYKEIPKCYSDWDKYVETNEKGAWKEVNKAFEELSTKESVNKEELLTLENGYAPYMTQISKKDDEWIDVLPSDKQEETAPMNPEDYLGDNSYERWVKNTPLKDKIRGRRKAMGLTAKEVADKMGISDSTYYNWENGVSQGPRYREVREKLAEVLGFKMEELF